MARNIPMMKRSESDQVIEYIDNRLFNKVKSIGESLGYGNIVLSAEIRETLSSDQRDLLEAESFVREMKYLFENYSR